MIKFELLVGVISSLCYTHIFTFNYTLISLLLYYFNNISILILWPQSKSSSIYEVATFITWYITILNLKSIQSIRYDWVNKI